MVLASVITCPLCGASGQEGLFCRGCKVYMVDATASVQRVTYNRRFFGTYLLEGLLFLVTLIIGWYIWLTFTAKTSQTPAKRLLNVYTLEVQTGQPITAGRVWVREVVVKQVGLAIANAVIGVAWFVDGLWVLIDKNRQAVHDKIVGTIVIYAPNGLPPSLKAPAEVLGTGTSQATAKDVAEQLRELAKLREEGILTEEEYEAKRKELTGKL